VIGLIAIVAASVEQGVWQSNAARQHWRVMKCSGSTQNGAAAAAPLIMVSSFRDGPKDQTSDAQLRIGESRDSGLGSSSRPGITGTD
jgi:hypothetical protein